MNWLCRIFGHKYNPVEEIMLMIKAASINSGELDYKIKCRRCGETKDMNNADNR